MFQARRTGYFPLGCISLSKHGLDLLNPLPVRVFYSRKIWEQGIIFVFLKKVTSDKVFHKQNYLVEGSILCIEPHVKVRVSTGLKRYQEQTWTPPDNAEMGTNGKGQVGSALCFCLKTKLVIGTTWMTVLLEWEVWTIYSYTQVSCSLHWLTGYTDVQLVHPSYLSGSIFILWKRNKLNPLGDRLTKRICFGNLWKTL